MREMEELFADSGESARVSRGTALKVGGLGLAGAIVGLMPGRAGSAVRRRFAVQSCSSYASTTCGQGPVTCNFNNNCSCITVFTKLHKAGGTTTACAQGFAGSITCATTPCSGKTCGSFVAGCNGNGSCYCYQSPGASGGCGPSIPCYGATACTTSSDCPGGSFCATNTCCGAAGICIPNCASGKPCPQGTECDSQHFCADPRSTCCPSPVCVPKCGAGGGVTVRARPGMQMSAG